MGGLTTEHIFYYVPACICQIFFPLNMAIVCIASIPMSFFSVLDIVHRAYTIQTEQIHVLKMDLQAVSLSKIKKTLPQFDGSLNKANQL